MIFPKCSLPRETLNQTGTRVIRQIIRGFKMETKFVKSLRFTLCFRFQEEECKYPKTKLYDQCIDKCLKTPGAWIVLSRAVDYLTDERFPRSYLRTEKFRHAWLLQRINFKDGNKAMKKYPTCVCNELHAIYFVFSYQIIQGVNWKNHVRHINKFLDKLPKSR